MATSYSEATFPISNANYAGLLVVNVVAILSTLALFTIIVRVVWLAVLRLYKQNISQTKEYVFFHTQLGYYAACLLVANMFSSAAGVMGVPYLVQRYIQQDPLCTAQALFMQFGNVATAYFTVSIAVHTFTSLVLRKRQSALVYSTTISMGWIISALISALPLILPHSRGPIYGEYFLTCGVRAQYPRHQFLLHLLPIFIAAVASVILYSLIFLVLRGTLVIKGGVKLTLNPEDRWTGRSGENYHRFIAGIARSMLWYPIAYILLLVPYSITKLLILSGFAVAFEALIFAYVCWSILGVVNVLLLYNTFRMLYPAFETKFTTKGEGESFANNEKFRRLTLGDNKSGLGDLERSVQDYRTFETTSPSYPEKTAAVPSFYSYPVSPQASPSPPSAYNHAMSSDHYRAASLSSTNSRGSQSVEGVDVQVPGRTYNQISPRGPALQVRNIPSPVSGRSMTTETASTRRLLTPSPNQERTSAYTYQASPRQQQRPLIDTNRTVSTASSADLLNEISRWVSEQPADGTMPSVARSQQQAPTFPRAVATNSRPRLASPTGSPALYSLRSQSPSGSPGGIPSSPSQYAPNSSRAAIPRIGAPPTGRFHQPRNGSF